MLTQEVNPAFQLPAVRNLEKVRERVLAPAGPYDVPGDFEGVSFVYIVHMPQCFSFLMLPFWVYTLFHLF